MTPDEGKRSPNWLPTPPPINPAEWVKKCVNALTPGYAVGMQLHIPLPEGPEAASVARAKVRGIVAEWGLHRPVDDLMVIVSELVTNAFRYGKSPIVLHLTLEDGHIIVGVQDTEPDALPTPQEAQDHEPTGRGLRLISAMASHWGWEKAGTQKVVWAQVPDN